MKRLLAVYVLLLVLSHVVRLWQPEEGALRPGQKRLAVGAYAGDERLERGVEIAYRDINRSGKADAPVLVMIHGSPLDSRSFDGIIGRLGEGFRLIIPDMPGFGGSTREVADYSVRAHANSVLELLDKLGVGRAHWLGYSQGGGVILEAQRLAPHRVESLVMLSSIGVIELELLGDYLLNRPLYALQLGGLWLLQEGVPHFGAWDRFILNKQFARNFWDTDMRPLRGILEGYAGPMLIVHGEADALVPLSAAREHHRIVPQSELVLAEGGHMLVFNQPEAVARYVGGFVRRVEAGEATDRAGADAGRLAAAVAPFDPRAVPPAAGLDLLILCGLIVVATLVSEDLACIGAGFLAANGTLPLWVCIAASFGGILFGDLALYLLGRWAGHGALRMAPLKWFVSAGKVADAEVWFRQEGMKLIMASRFVPGTRLPTFVAAGALRSGFFRVGFYLALASLVWTPILVGLAAVVGRPVLEGFRLYSEFALPLLVVGGGVLYLLFHYGAPMLSYKGRRLLVSKWRRNWRWEFWPAWKQYPPVVLYILWLGVRYRSLTLFTVTNPAMPESGFVGESKSAILGGLAGAGDVVPRWTLLRLEDGLRFAELEAFMHAHGLDYPVVLKPDEGQRGVGVKVVRDAGQARDYLQVARSDIIAQAFAPGEEFGVFYYRYPGEERGHILGINAKRLLSVTGDGVRTLERLILDDERAVCLAQHFLHVHRERIYHVPARGERVLLVDIGTHALGAVFIEASGHATDALTAEIDRISRCYEGFYFGRYDLCAPSVEDLRAGRNLKVIELNGITAESTNIYDPAHGARFAWGTLLRQWRIAFEIAAANRARGHAPTPPLAFLKGVAAALRRQRGSRDSF